MVRTSGDLVNYTSYAVPECGTFLLLSFVFALAERKNERQIAWQVPYLPGWLAPDRRQLDVLPSTSVDWTLFQTSPINSDTGTVTICARLQLERGSYTFAYADATVALPIALC